MDLNKKENPPPAEDAEAMNKISGEDVVTWTVITAKQYPSYAQIEETWNSAKNKENGNALARFSIIGRCI